MGAGNNYNHWSEQDKQQNYAETGSYYGRPREHEGKPYWAPAYQLGQDPNYASQQAANYQDLAQKADARATPTADYGFANQSRGMQLGSLAILRSAAQGGQPSAAEAQYRLGMNAAGANAGYGLAGGGSPLNIANAQRSGAYMGAQTMGVAGIQAANARSAEDLSNINAYTMSGLGMRGQDIGQSAYDANLALQGRTLNDQRALGYYGMRDSSLEAQRDAYLREQADLARYSAVMSGEEMAARDRRRQQQLALAQTTGGVVQGAAQGAAAAGAFK